MARPPLYLLTGPEELLLQRAADDLVTELRAEGPVEVVDLRIPELGEDGLPDLRTGSLFGDRRVIVLREAAELPAALGAQLLAEVEQTPPDATVILLATGTGRMVKLAKRVTELGGRVDIAPPREWDARGWARLVGNEFARHDRAGDDGAVQAILSHAGLDVSGICEKVAQVTATAPAGSITAEHVDAVVVGHGSRGSFAVADAMCDRDPARALELLRGVLESGDDPVMVLGALAYRLRAVVAVAARLDGRQLGLRISGGQANRLRGVRRNFGPGELTAAYRTLAAADAEIKGGELPADLVIERAVVRIATAG